MDFRENLKGFLDKNSPLVGSLFGQLFGGSKENPAEQAMKDIGQIPGMVKPYYDPYMEAGKKSLGELQGQYGDLLTNPGQKMNQFGQEFQKSPGFDFALKQALAGAGNAAAAGGMAGSPQHQQQNMEIATQLGNQDYNHWLSNALGLYGKGLGGEENIFNTGYNASTGFGETVGNTQLQKALLDYISKTQKDKESSGLWNTIGEIGGSLLKGFL